MTVGLTVPLLAALLGIPVGAIAGWRGGRFDSLFLRVVEIWTAIPTYMLAILFVAVWGGGLDKLILYLVIVSWIGLARLARAQVVVAQGPRVRALGDAPSARRTGACCCSTSCPTRPARWWWAW